MSTAAMTWDEICAAYPDEYVVLCPVEVDDQLEVRRGVVLGHGRARKELLANTSRVVGALEAILYTGPVSGNFSLSFPARPGT